MPLNAGLCLGIAAAVAWGTADFCAKKAAARVGFWGALAGTNAVGALALGTAAAAGWAVPFGADWRFWLVLGAGNTVAGLLFYFALEHGRLSLVSPLTAAYPVVAVALAFVVAHEHLRWALALAVGAAMAGALLAAGGSGKTAAAASTRRKERSALAAAAAGAVLFGLVFFGLDHGGGALAVAPVLLFRLTGAVLLGVPLLAARPAAAGALTRCHWVWTTGVLDSAAYLAYVASLRYLPVSIAAPLGGLFTAWTLVLARVFLHERLGRRQWCGIGLILAAIASLARLRA